MTDKFVVGSNEIGEIIVTDVETDRVYRYNDISKFFGLIRLLNEQQSTINKLKSDIEETEISIKLFEDDIATKDKKIEEQQATIQQLQAQLREKEQDEKLYANEILELRETNKEFIQFKSLGGDY